MMKKRRHTEYIKGFPYYRIQYWDELSICWANIPKTFPNPQKAEDFAFTLCKKFRMGKKFRIMEVMKEGQKPFKTIE